MPLTLWCSRLAKIDNNWHENYYPSGKLKMIWWIVLIVNLFLLKKLSDVVFTSPGGSVDSVLAENTANALSANALAFSMHRGAVEALCPTESDAKSPWVVNFKRGVLSALQTGKGDMRQSHVAHEVKLLSKLILKIIFTWTFYLSFITKC